MLKLHSRVYVRRSPVQAWAWCLLLLSPPIPSFEVDNSKSQKLHHLVNTHRYTQRELMSFHHPLSTCGLIQCASHLLSLPLSQQSTESNGDKGSWPWLIRSLCSYRTCVCRFQIWAWLGFVYPLLPVFLSCAVSRNDSHLRNFSSLDVMPVVHPTGLAVPATPCFDLTYNRYLTLRRSSTLRALTQRYVRWHPCACRTHGSPGATYTYVHGWLWMTAFQCMCTYVHTYICTYVQNATRMHNVV